MARSCDTYTSKDGSISITAYSGNGHGVHTNMFPVNYEEIVDIPDDIIFRTNQCLISSFYCRLYDKGIEDFELLSDRISNGLLWKKRDCLCHSDLATKDSVVTYLKYVNTSDVKNSIRVYNFDKLLDFEKKKTSKLISNDIEMELFNRIINLDNISDSFNITIEVLALDDNKFKKAALLLIKCMVYDIEDKHYLDTKKHNKEDVLNLKLYKKTLYSQI